MQRQCSKLDLYLVTLLAVSMLHSSKVTALAHHTARVTAAYVLLPLSWWQTFWFAHAGKQCSYGCLLTPGYQCHSRLPVPFCRFTCVCLSYSGTPGSLGFAVFTACRNRQYHSQSHRYTIISVQWSDVLVACCLLPASCCYSKFLSAQADLWHP